MPNNWFGVVGGAKYRVLGQSMAVQRRELNPRPPDPKPCGQPLGYMGSVWVVWGANYDVLMDWGAKYKVLGGLVCQI